jgi:predicted AlkP superfamily pyrophosphatase or phosphodiesterase
MVPGAHAAPRADESSAVAVASAGDAVGAANAPRTGEVGAAVAPPKLVVVLVMDQLRGDYLARFRPFFGEQGFKRFLERGAYFTQGRYQNAITKTCAGHAVVATGSHAEINGIIGNEWWDQDARGEMYCAGDAEVELIGSDRPGRSPRNLIGTTIGDVLKLSNVGQSRVVTVAGKDRSAIMLGGRLADAAYWMEDSLFVTSTYYRKDLPDWARRFNGAGKVSAYFGKEWDRALPAEAYRVQGPDDVPEERSKGGMGRTFPHPLGVGEARPGKGFIEAFETTPFHNDIVLEFAMEAVRNERLGRGGAPDILGISFSANDRVGHAYGPDSHEVMDMMVRSDQLLERLFAFLDEEVGLEQTLVVLTGDHGVAPLPEFVNRQFPNAGALRMHPREVRETVEEAMTARYGAAGEGRSWVSFQKNPQVYLNADLLAERKIPVAEAETTIQAAVGALPGIFAAHTRTELATARAAGGASSVLLSFYPERSGHLVYILKPYVIEDSNPDGTDHGTPWSYDQLVPIVWYGAGIRAGVYHTEAYVADIAPTIAAILGIDKPAGATGRVLTEGVAAGSAVVSSSAR